MKYEEFKTATACREAAARNLGPLTAELVVRATAPARTLWREAETIRAAAGNDEEYLIQGVQGPVFFARSAARIRLDLAGVGGPLDAAGAGTDRMPQFRGLGKGRWHASDGRVWRAAAEAALRTLQQGIGIAGGYLAVELRGGRPTLIDAEDNDCWHFAGLAPVRWLRAEATRAALHAALVGNWEPALSWSDDAIEVALQECLWIEADTRRETWLATAKIWHPVEFRQWVEKDGNDAAEQAAMEQAMGSPLPEGGEWP